MSDASETIKFLRGFNRWRRGDESLEQPCASEVGKMIDAACDHVERGEKMQSALQRLADCDWSISLPDRMDAVRKIAREALQ